MKINNKKILITGASSGIGRELLIELLKYDGVKIIAASIDIEILDIKDSKIIPYKCDVSKKEELDKLFSFAEENLGTIDIFFANAGFAYYEKIEEPDYERIDKIYRTNVFAPLYITEYMNAKYSSKDYKVVITASAMGKLPLAGYALYSSTKSALDSFASAFRYELKQPSKVMVVYPIATKTNFFKASGGEPPIPFPVQSANFVAKKIIRGVLNDKKSVYPSKIFRTMMILERFIPICYYLYAKGEQKKFIEWYKNRKNINADKVDNKILEKTK